MKYFIFLFSIIPNIVFAQGARELLVDLTGVVGLLMSIGFTLAFMVFAFGLAKFISKSGDTASHEGGKRLMVWGIIALFVMVSAWSIIYFIQGEFNLEVGDGSGTLLPPLKL